jgi:hypothetical protein
MSNDVTIIETHKFKQPSSWNYRLEKVKKKNEFEVFIWGIRSTTNFFNFYTAIQKSKIRAGAYLL